MVTVTYNGVELPYCTIHSFEQEPVLTPDGADYLYTRYLLHVSCVYNPGTTGDDLLPSESYEEVKTRLEAPRGALKVSVGSEADLLTSPAKGSSVDANNGPRPLGVTITRLDGDRTWLVSFRVETWLYQCHSNAKYAPALISNRWEQRHRIDERHFTEIVTSGQAIFSSAGLEPDLVVDQFRDAILPLIPRGFKRISTDIVVASNRNVLQYTTVDREQPIDIGETDPELGGPGIKQVEARYTSTTQTGEGVSTPMILAAVEVQVWGGRNSSIARLTHACYQIAGTKLPLHAIGPAAFLRQASVTQSMTDKFVAMHLVMQLAPKAQARISLLDDEALRIEDIFGDQGGINPQPPKDMGTRGTWDGLAVAQALKTACEPVAAPPGYEAAGTTVMSRYDPSGPEPAVTVRVADVLPPQPVKIREQYSVYTDYQIDSDWYDDPQVAAAPSTMPGVPTAYYNLGSPVQERVVRWTAERVGAKPAIPLPEPDPESNYVLLSKVISPAHRQLTADGQAEVYRVTGVYRYGLKIPKERVPSLDLGLLPWMASGYDAITPSDYDNTII
ncbi:MAG: hypothetical protein IRY99_09285 [Isosphaeraceae bacterium]|nr:hypothetical protein [Isosphaeraceae bacterium]